MTNACTGAAISPLPRPSATSPATWHSRRLSGGHGGGSCRARARTGQTAPDCAGLLSRAARASGLRFRSPLRGAAVGAAGQINAITRARHCAGQGSGTAPDFGDFGALSRSSSQVSGHLPVAAEGSSTVGRTLPGSAAARPAGTQFSCQQALRWPDRWRGPALWSHGPRAARCHFWATGRARRDTDPEPAPPKRRPGRGVLAVVRHHTRGGGGNRTRVLQYITRASPGAACCVFLSPGGHAGKPPTGSAAVRCPGQSRGRVAQLSLLADASHRAGGAPGLTASLLAQAARAKLVR
jgi:hypothetical protein